MYYNRLLENLLNSLNKPYEYDYIILLITDNLAWHQMDFINQKINLDKYKICNIQNLPILLNSLQNNYFSLKVNQEISLEEILKTLEESGYRFSPDPLEKFTYQTRGNIIDINFQYSVRIEIEDNKIESIRTFDPQTLLSQKKLNYIRIPIISQNTNLLLNYKILILTTIDPEIISNILERKIKETQKQITWQILKIEDYFKNNIQKINSILEVIPLLKTYKIIFSSQQTYSLFIQFLIDYCKKKKLKIEEIFPSNYEILEEEDNLFGYIDNTTKEIYLTNQEFYQTEQLISQNILESINEFKEGDLVVVEGYGIGIYLGTKKIKVSHLEEKEFVQIQFKNNRKISFAIEYVNLHKYISSDKISQKIKEKILSIPSFKSWQKKLEKVYYTIKTTGNKILEINAKRYSTLSYELKPNDLDILPEETCNFILTKDQEKVVQEVLNDLSKKFPANRLILADTGYGKTEILIRAINRCLSNGYKALLFVPTTILAYQHFKYIKQRLPLYKIDINTSIYKTVKNLESLENIELLISTPFDISKIKNGEGVGLIVLDEEHLMGALFKETLKEKFFRAHFLYSSATPIPRTYFMAKTGIIDVSIINTPPPAHKKPLTLVITFHNKNHKLLILQKILSQSLKLSLKTIYVNNNIDELYEMWTHFQDLVDIKKMSIIHGKLSSKSIQKTFIEFIEGKIDLILSTVIIQAGIDTPEFDVVIIDNSHLLGISQIYQLRGRVGRGSKNPACYILIDEKFVGTPTFERISIFEKEDVSNVEIVQRDLDIRGPGSILSLRQSGHIEQIGLIQFLKMINEYLNKEENLPLIECNQPTYLPDSPIKNKLYRQIFTAKTLEDLEIIKKEIEDVYGKNLPQPTINLLKIIEYRIRNKGKKDRIRVKITNDKVVEI